LDDKESIDIRLFRNISLNTLQVLSNQILGVFLFLLLSRYLDKDSYGELNWSLAVLTTITAILSLRLEQIVVRDVAAGKDPSALLALFLFHTVMAALLFLLILLGARFLFPEFFGRHSLLWLLSFSQLLLFISLPFRQLVTGKAAFGWLAALMNISNIVRCAGLLGMLFFSSFTLLAVLWLFTLSAAAEWLLGAFIVFRKLHIPLDWKQRATGYTRLIKDSLPQVGMVFLTAGMARIDWILMGLFSTPAHTAEYSFAYRAYEFSPLPLLVLAPFLLNSFSRRYTNGVFQTPSWLNDLVRAEMIVATVLPLIGVLVWAPLMDGLTLDKYGQVNWVSFLLLSCTIPFQYLINVHWTAEFAGNRLKRIFGITAITAGIVLVGDAALIPFLAGKGAAIAWLVAMVVQYFLYARKSLLTGARVWNRNLFIAIALALAVGWAAVAITSSVVLRLCIALAGYVLLMGPAGLVRREDYRALLEKLPPAWMGWLRKSLCKSLQRVNWSLLLFLTGVLNVKLYIKIVAILFGLIIHWGKRIPRDVFRKSYLWFYAAMLLLAVCNLFLSPLSFTGLLAFGLGSGYWLLALSAAYYIYLFVRQEDIARLHRTVSLFFLLNSVCIGICFLVICLQAGTINPYTFEGMHRQYFISTGDKMTGISLDGSVTAAMIGAFGIFYFLYRNKPAAMLFCLLTVLLCGSNFVDIMLIMVFLFIFIFRTDRLQKSMIVVSFLLIALFWAKVSPQNGQYVQEIVKRADKKNVYVEPVPIPNAKPTEFVEKKEITNREGEMKFFEETLYPPNMEDSFKTKFRNYNRSGRWIAWQEMARFFRDHPQRLPIGAGMGHFSSRLAFKTAALDIVGTWPLDRRYIHPFFRDNYLYLYLYYHSRDEGQHSVVNKPDSVYGQLLGEYGLIGLLLFGLFYVTFFLKQSRFLSYGLPLLLFMGMAFFTEYWFEQLSVVILFELLLLLDQKANLKI
jgi:O-antigen/teichoic acid export membrane protein